MRPHVDPVARLHPQQRDASVSEHGVDLEVSLLPVPPVMAFVIEFNDKGHTTTLIDDGKVDRLCCDPVERSPELRPVPRPR